MAAEILAIAGVNGAGKSSIAGAALMRLGATCCDPDRATRRYVRAGLPAADANSRAWQRGRAQLQRAIVRGTSYAFETTLGGRTMTRLLLEAADAGHRVRVWYVGLASPELHIQRVRSRVARGGHNIPEATIRARWTTSRKNVIRLLPCLSELAVHDNTFDADPMEGENPQPLRILSVRDGAIVYLAPAKQVREWAKPIVAAAVDAWSAP